MCQFPIYLTTYLPTYLHYKYYYSLSLLHNMWMNALSPHFVRGVVHQNSFVSDIMDKFANEEVLPDSTFLPDRLFNSVNIAAECGNSSTDGV